MRCSECCRLSATFEGLIHGHALLRGQQQAKSKRRTAAWTRLIETALSDSSESMRAARGKLLAHEATHAANAGSKTLVS